MIRSLSRWFARWRYIWNEEVKASEAELNGLAAAKNARDFKTRLERVANEANDIEARIKEVSAMEEKGYWLCENGDESDTPDTPCYCHGNDGLAIVHVDDCPLKGVTTKDGYDPEHPTCSRCGKPMKLIKRSEMTGHEQYESDKERGEAEKIAANKRSEAAQIEEDIKNQENARSIFLKQAARSREFADALRKL